MKGCFYKIGSDDSLASVNLTSVDLEKKIHRIFENNLEALLGIKFLAREHTLDSGDRIDTLGIDSNNRPVIIEYKKENKRYVLSQVRNYAKSLAERKFVILVARKIDDRAAENVDTQNKRMICIAKEFTPHDIKMAEDDGIELIEYGILENDILVLEQVVGEGKPKHIRTRPLRVEPPAKPNSAPIQLAQKPTAVEIPTRQRTPRPPMGDLRIARREKSLEAFVDKISKGKAMHQDGRYKLYLSEDGKIATLITASSKHVRDGITRPYFFGFSAKPVMLMEELLSRGVESYITIYLSESGIYAVPYEEVKQLSLSRGVEDNSYKMNAYFDPDGLRIKSKGYGFLIAQYKIAEAP